MAIAYDYLICARIIVSGMLERPDLSRSQEILLRKRLFGMYHHAAYTLRVRGNHDEAIQVLTDALKICAEEDCREPLLCLVAETHMLLGDAYLDVTGRDSCLREYLVAGHMLHDALAKLCGVDRQAGPVETVGKQDESSSLSNMLQKLIHKSQHLTKPDPNMPDIVDITKSLCKLEARVTAIVGGANNNCP